MKLKALLNILEKKKRLAIFAHDAPDPDSITSAYILGRIAAKTKTKSSIIYGGCFTRAENLEMVSKLKINLTHVKDFDPTRYDGFALVDTQKNMGNNSFPDSILPDITFDHHQSEVKRYRFYDINTKVGATSTIVLKYFFKLNLPVSKKLATAYHYALISETQDLGRGTAPMDLHFFRRTYSQVDFLALSKMRHARKHLDYFHTLKRALKSYTIRDRIVTCQLGKISSSEYVSEIADVLIRIDSVDYSLVIGNFENEYVISCRAYKETSRLGDVLHRLIKGQGKAGGHDMMAAGKFTGDPNAVIQKFIRILSRDGDSRTR